MNLSHSPIKLNQGIDTAVGSWGEPEKSSTLGLKQPHMWVRHRIFTQNLKVLDL